MDQPRCPFCYLEASRIRLENEAAAAILDGFPVAEGHTLVIPRRHVASVLICPTKNKRPCGGWWS